MTKQAFMKELEAELTTIDKSAREELLEDISDHFLAGAAIGLSEADICKGLGQASAIAAQAKEDLGVAETAPQDNDQKRRIFEEKTKWNRDKFQKPELTEETQVFPSSITAIDVQSKLSNLNIFPSESDEIRVVSKLAHASFFKASVIDGVLCIRYRYNSGQLDSDFPETNWGSMTFRQFPKSPWDTIAIYLPKQHQISMKVSTSVGHVLGLNVAARFDVRTSAGSITFTGSDISGSSLRASAGHITVDAKELSLNGLYVKSSAGSAKVWANQTENLEVKSSAGSAEVNVQKLVGNTTIRSSAGSATITALEILGHTSITTSVGDVTVNLPKNIDCSIHSKASGFQIAGKRISGDVEGHPNSSNTLYLKSSMGSIRLKGY